MPQNSNYTSLFPFCVKYRNRPSFLGDLRTHRIPGGFELEGTFQLKDQEDH